MCTGWCLTSQHFRLISGVVFAIADTTGPLLFCSYHGPFPCLSSYVLFAESRMLIACGILPRMSRWVSAPLARCDHRTKRQHQQHDRTKPGAHHARPRHHHYCKSELRCVRRREHLWAGSKVGMGVHRSDRAERGVRYVYIEGGRRTNGLDRFKECKCVRLP